MVLLQKIKKKKANIAVIGLGYVGLELLINIRNSGFNVLGFDKNLEKIDTLKKGKSPISTIEEPRVKILEVDKIFSTKKIKLINQSDIIIICVPTPLKNNKRPDMKFINETLNLIYGYLRPEQLIILESTVYPGATEEIFVNKINKKKNIKIGKNFYLSFSPERVSPGKDYKISYTNITKIISGYSPKCLKIVKYFYQKIFRKIYSTSSIKTAEFTKLYENAYRSVNIGLVNQMKIIADGLGLNIFDVISAAKTKPFGFRPFLPGPGVGGHCIPIDPLFISWVSDKKKLNSDFIKISRKVNIDVTNWALKKIKKNLIKNNNKILIIGVTYKKDVDDVRESPVIKIFQNLSLKNSVDFYDPYVNKILLKKTSLFSIKNLNKIFKYDAVIIGTDHRKIDYKFVAKNSKKIFDTRGVFSKLKLKNVIFC